MTPFKHGRGGIHFVCLLVVATSAWAQGTGLSRPAAESPSQVAAFWTEDRLRTAIPMPLPQRSGAASHVKRTPGRPPNIVSLSNPTLCAGAHDSVNGPPHKAVPVTDGQNNPFCSIGKLYFINNGQSYVCSASAVSEFEYLTAGHCLFAPSSHTFSQQLLLVMPDGGRFYSVKTFTFKEWQQGDGQNFFYDLGFVKTSASMHAEGNLGMGALSSLDGTIFVSCCTPAVGYPAAPPFNGSMYKATGDADLKDGDYPMTQGMPNDMTGGSSGGPWLRPFESSGGYWAIGINDYKHTDDANDMYSPQFGPQIIALWHCVTTDTCGS